ncbi:MAG: DNA polymerase III subunit alpha, partial [Planctomycetota bacterium]
MATCYAPLLLRSNFSLLVGASSIERIVERARSLGLSSVVLTDFENLYGAVPFYKLAREAGVKPILGAELSSEGARVVLLARDLVGYAHLCTLITWRKLEENFSLADRLVEFQEGLHILTEDADLAGELAPRVDRDRLLLLLASPGRGVSRWDGLCRRAGELGIGVAATPDVYFLDEDEYAIHRALAAIRENTLVSRLTAEEVAHRESFFPPPERIARLFRGYREALENSARIAEDCNLELPLGKPIFPKYALGEGETARGFLAKLCAEGLARRYRDGTPEAAARLARELAIIDRLSFTEYFIFVWDIMGFARERGIPTVGRGSGASSMVSYVLGITQADPLKYDLPFERFLHMQRVDCPDLDIDLCWIKRDEVIENVYRKYGASRVAMVSTHATFRLRSAFREAAKAFGVPNDTVNRMSARLPYDAEESVGEVLADAGVREAVSLSDETLEEIARVAEKIRGFPRHLGVHCGGLVIGDKALENYVPLEEAAKGVVITQYEKDAIEAIGLVKMDLLGNHGLTIREEAVKLIRETRGVEVDIDAVPDSDEATGEMLASGRTLSCCQLESPAMRNLLTMLRVRSTKGLMQALALIRPAPASLGMKEEFVRRARGLAPTVFAHPALKAVLGETYGIMLYEDDAMLVASALAGISMEEGDLLRRAIARRARGEELFEVSEFFMKKAVANGIPFDLARETWVQMAKFNSYSFCKAHAASYAILAYELAYLKAHWPLEFMTAVLNHQWGMYPKRAHLEEAKRLGVRVLPPCVKRSGEAFTIEEGAIRIGLGDVKGLSQRGIASILAARRRKAFTSLGDFLGRARITEPEAENLILCGALDFTGRIRPEMILELKTRAKCAREDEGESLIAVEPAPLARAGLADYSARRKLAYELSILELIPGEHPMKILRPTLARRGLIDSSRLRARVGKIVRIAGVAIAFRGTSTKS